MWTPEKAKLVKVLLHAQGEDPETPWAEDLGPDPSRPSARLVRLANVPFLHAKPTYGDVISVEYDDEYGRHAWDSQGVPWSQIHTRIHEDGGRWAMIIDYHPAGAAGVNLQEAYSRLYVAAEAADIAVEGAYVREEERRGRAYLAVPGHLDVEQVLQILADAQHPLDLTLVHPAEEEVG